MYADMLVCKP